MHTATTLTNNDLSVFWKKKEFCYTVLSIIVIMNHTLGYDFYQNNIDVSNFHKYIINLFGGTVLSSPFYFIFSAVLFYRNITNIKDVLRKAKSHFVKLFIPYILWNVIGCLFAILISYTPFISKYVAVRELFEFNFQNIFQGVFMFKYNYVYWFMAQLLIYTLLAPIFYLLLKNKYVSILALVGFYILHLFGVDIPFEIYKSGSLMYYFLGAFVGKYLFIIVRPTHIKFPG